MHYRREWVSLPTGTTPDAGTGAHADRFEQHLRTGSGKTLLQQKTSRSFPDGASGTGVQNGR